jgi:hypothetical protein
VSLPQLEAYRSEMVGAVRDVGEQLARPSSRSNPTASCVRSTTRS